MHEPWNVLKAAGVALTLSGLAAVRWVEFLRQRGGSHLPSATR
jgi:hypothetical protein